MADQEQHHQGGVKESGVVALAKTSYETLENHFLFLRLILLLAK